MRLEPNWWAIAALVAILAVVAMAAFDIGGIFSAPGLQQE